MSHAAIMTFHGSHNFGSVFQAYALKRKVEQLGLEAEIINFRPIAQIDKYSLVPRMYGMKTAIKSLMRATKLGQIKRSHQKYEDFIARYLTSSEMFTEMSGFSELPEYDVYITGSDQVWGYSIPEFVKASEDIRPAYYCSFTSGKKVSYASSTGEATISQLEPYAAYLSHYSSISVRENKSVDIVRKLTGRDCVCCLDPTFLLSGGDYDAMLRGQRYFDDGEYILLYSLQGMRINKEWLELAGKASEKLGLPVLSVSPFCTRKSDCVRPIYDAGPLDILGLFSNATYVLTDTFHGTLFSTHFDKQFVTFVPGRDDPRMRDVLVRLGLADRIAHSVADGVRLLDQTVDYESVSKRRSIEVGNSIRYLETALKEQV